MTGQWSNFFCERKKSSFPSIAANEKIWFIFNLSPFPCKPSALVSRLNFSLSFRTSHPPTSWIKSDHPIDLPPFSRTSSFLFILRHFFPLLSSFSFFSIFLSRWQTFFQNGSDPFCYSYSSFKCTRTQPFTRMHTHTKSLTYQQIHTHTHAHTHTLPQSSYLFLFFQFVVAPWDTLFFLFWKCSRWWQLWAWSLLLFLAHTCVLSDLQTPNARTQP